MKYDVAEASALEGKCVSKYKMTKWLMVQIVRDFPGIYHLNITISFATKSYLAAR
ncbi:hypothetical protein GCM10011511_15950 [Puia dinghuensis]|uniref:Uncharacterized protein n=1 Tax=Puia dinghuensis TaxID=1792502 RepID=A0A8J2XS88_9BACT|nr:hypothetical protein GCM10011511_15950 [Puia dinghuensis]